MKKIFFCIVTMLAFSCGITTKNQIPEMPGAYQMLSKTLTVGKTTSVAGDINQSKIYTEEHFIYAATHDSIAYFAVGTYTQTGAELIEQVLFSAYDTSILQPANYKFDIEKTPQGFSQTMKNAGTLQGTIPAFIEKYKPIGNKAKCQMDGAWKLLQSYAVQNKDTTWDNYTDYKLCFDGYIIWGAVTFDSSTKKHKTYMGISSFEMKETKGRELCINSNYFQNKGMTFDMDVEFKNRDEFKQTIVDSATGIRYVEIYKRLNRQ